MPALGLEHFQSFAAAAASGEVPPETDMTALHMQGGFIMLVAAYICTQMYTDGKR